MNSQRRKALAFAGAALAAGAGALAMVPRASVVEMTASMPLDTLFPPLFDAWKIDSDVIALEVGADLRKVVAETYDQTLARTYVNRQGYRVMLSVAYGGRRNQGMDIHRPEVCYPAQGMALRRETHEAVVGFGDAQLPVKRLVAGVGNRNEPITYWLVIGRSVASFGYGHRLALLKYGLTGHVPDGMLVRLSSIDNDEKRAFAEQGEFLQALLAAMTPDFRRRVMGQG